MRITQASFSSIMLGAESLAVDEAAKRGGVTGVVRGGCVTGENFLGVMSRGRLYCLIFGSFLKLRIGDCLIG